MPAAKSKQYGINPDIPLRTLAPTGGWIGKEPRAYVVRAPNAGEALSLAVFVAYVCQGTVPRKHAGRVGHALTDLSVPGRTFQILVGKKPASKGEKWLATEITEITKET